VRRVVSRCSEEGGSTVRRPFVFAQDKGKLTINSADRPSHEEFEIAPSGGGWVPKHCRKSSRPESSASRVVCLAMRSHQLRMDSQRKDEWRSHLFAMACRNHSEMQGARPCTATE